MIQLIQENRRPRQPKFSERLLSGLGSLASEATSQVPRMLMGRQQEGRENEAIKRLSGKDVSGLSPELKKIFLAQHLKTPTGTGSHLATASHALDRMESLLKKPGVGLGGGWNPFGEARGNIGEFQAAQAGILPLFKQFFPRGFSEKEFIRIMDQWVPQPNERVETTRGKIRGLRKLLEQQDHGNVMDQLMKGPEQTIGPNISAPKRRPLSSFGD